MVSRSESACPPSLVITQLKLSLQAIQHEKREKKTMDYFFFQSCKYSSLTTMWRFIDVVQLDLKSKLFFVCLIILI